MKINTKHLPSTCTVITTFPKICNSVQPLLKTTCDQRTFFPKSTIIFVCFGQFRQNSVDPDQNASRQIGPQHEINVSDTNEHGIL